MKKVNSLRLSILFILLLIGSSFSPVEHGVYVQLLPGSKKIVIQIVPDKTYANVVAHINFYSASNKRVGQQAYNLSDEKDKYVRKDVCTNKVFKFDFDETVKRVTIDHVNEGEILSKDDAGPKGTKLNLPVSESALGPVGK